MKNLLTDIFKKTQRRLEENKVSFPGRKLTYKDYKIKLHSRLHPKSSKLYIYECEHSISVLYRIMYFFFAPFSKAHRVSHLVQLKKRVVKYNSEWYLKPNLRYKIPRDFDPSKYQLGKLTSLGPFGLEATEELRKKADDERMRKFWAPKGGLYMKNRGTCHPTFGVPPREARSARTEWKWVVEPVRRFQKEGEKK